MFEGCQEEQHVREARSFSHHANAPDAAGERTKTRADLDVELLQQLPSDRSFVHTIRNADSIQRPEPLAFWREQVEGKRRETGGQRLVVGAMARVTPRETLI